MKKSARRRASTTSDTGDTSSKQQQAQRKENYNKSKRPVSSVDHCHPYRRKKREEKQFTKPTHVAVYLSPAVRVKHMQMMTVLFSLHGVSFGVSNVKLSPIR